MFKNIILVMALLLSISLKAQYVSQQEALSYAKSFLQTKDAQYTLLDQTEKLPDYCSDLMHVFRIKPKGYIMIAADKKAFPLIGYSFESEFPSEENQNFGSFLKSIAEQISDIQQIESIENEEWKLFSHKEIREEIPALLRNLWNQDAPYNYFCPEDPAGPGGHAYAGCVATAQSMVMQYWQWPYVGEGSDSYYHVTYGQLEADFTSGNYDPRGMILSADNKLCYPISELMYHCGIANHMGYGPDQSGTGSGLVSPAFKNFFKYDQASEMIFKDAIGNEAFIELLIEDLEAGRPVWTAGYSGSGGHAFVIDGVDNTDNFHYNFGWSGSGNGYYSILNSGGYNAGLRSVINVFPDEDKGYPYFQQGLDTVSYMQGSIFDGSGPLGNYIPNMNSQWLISPTANGDLIESFEINWIDMDLEEGDFVRIYAGTDESAPLVGEYTGNQLPEDLDIDSEALLVTFTTDDANEASGFLFEYFATPAIHCDAISQITDDNGSFDDGSGPYKYKNGTFCIWQIMPDNNNPLTIYFDAFDTEEDEDEVNIFDGANNQLLYTLSGSYNESNLPGPFVIESGKANIRFTSGAFENADGWEISYSTALTQISEVFTNKSIQFLPNPANDLIQIKYTGEQEYPIETQIYDYTGQFLRSLQINNNTITVDISEFPAGIYFVYFTAENATVVKKLIKK